MDEGSTETAELPQKHKFYKITLMRIGARLKEISSFAEFYHLSYLAAL
jgi:hypothetical protein